MAARPLAASEVPARKKPLGFFDGVGALFGGLRFILGRPSMWGWALIPTLFATLLFFGFGAVAIWGGTDLAHRIFSNDGAWSTAGFWVFRIALWIVGTIVAFLLAISFAQPLSGFALDAIARRQELALGGRSWPDQPFLASAIRSLRVTITALAVSLPILAVLSLITFVAPPTSIVTVPLKFLVTGLTVAYDFLDYPLGLRGASVRSRIGFIREHFAAVAGFGVAAALLLLVPGLGLVLLPFGVAGAARIVALANHVSSPSAR